MKRKTFSMNHKTMKYRYFLSALIILSTNLFSFANGTSSESFLDTLPLLNQDYKGYRLAVTDLVVEQKGGWLNIRYTAINTGKKDLALGKKGSTPPIILNIDDLSANSIFQKNKAAFSTALLETELRIKSGEILYNRELKIKANQSPIAAEIASIEQNDDSKDSLNSKDFIDSSEEEEGCSDLIIESISIVKQSKNSVTLRYKIKNSGKRPVSIAGKTKSKEDNLAMTVHMSSSEKLTRGATTIGGTFLKEGKYLPEGKLYPGKSLVDEIKVDIRNMTRFTPVIILEIDPYLSVQECNETNNRNHIKVKK